MQLMSISDKILQTILKGLLCAPFKIVCVSGLRLERRRRLMRSLILAISDCVGGAARLKVRI